MKRVHFLLTSLLVLFWAFPGPAAAQLTGDLGGPLGKVVDKAADPGKGLEEVVDKVKRPVDEAVTSLPGPLKEPVQNATKEVDKVIKSATGAAKDSAEAPGPGVENPKQAPRGETVATGNSKLDRSDSATSASRTRVAAGKSTGATRGTSRAESARDTEEVAAAGNAIEPAQVKGVHIVAPVTEVEDSQEGSGLSHTGAQLLSWLSLACLLVGAGIALAWGGRARVRAARA